MTVSNFLVEMFLHIFGRDFSSGIFLVEMFLHILLGRQMSLMRLFGRDVFSCIFLVCKMSLQSFLGIIF